jgi:serine protease Do
LIVPIDKNLIIDAVQNVSKTVVNIASIRMIHDQLYRVFPVEGVGSGIVVDDKGYILTNNHVIDKAHKLKIP